MSNLNRLRGWTLSVLGAVVFLFALPGAALACTCLEVPFDQEYSSMDYVFTARALASEPSTYPDHQIVHLRVFAIWKGTGVEEFMDVLVADSEGQCGYAFTPGTDYLVFADWYDSTYPVYTQSCSRTRPYNPSDPIFNELGPPLSTPAPNRSWGKIKAVYR